MVWTMRRHAARVVLLDRELHHVFMIHASDPADRSKRDWWETPGGGIHHGEESATTALRELYEEAGIVDAEVGPCVATQQVEFDFGGLHFEQDERVHVAWIDEMPADAYRQFPLGDEVVLENPDSALPGQQALPRAVDICAKRRGRLYGGHHDAREAAVSSGRLAHWSEPNFSRSAAAASGFSCSSFWM